MINERHEEILEAIWVAREKKKTSIEAIRDNCTIDFTATEVNQLAENKLVTIGDSGLYFTHEGEKKE